MRRYWQSSRPIWTMYIEITRYLLQTYVSWKISIRILSCTCVYVGSSVDEIIFRKPLSERILVGQQTNAIAFLSVPPRSTPFFRHGRIKREKERRKKRYRDDGERKSEGKRNPMPVGRRPRGETSTRATLCKTLPLVQEWRSLHYKWRTPEKETRVARTEAVSRKTEGTYTFILNRCFEEHSSILPRHYLI